MCHDYSFLLNGTNINNDNELKNVLVFVIQNIYLKSTWKKKWSLKPMNTTDLHHNRRGELQI